MARSLEQIRKDLELLETATARINDELKALYRAYLEALSRAAKQQLALAVYHLCTQVYPDAFLRLSVSQREKLQAGVRQIAQQGFSQIQQLSQVVEADSLSAMAQAGWLETETTETLEEPSDADTSDAAALESSPQAPPEAAPEAAEPDSPPPEADAESADLSEMAQRLSGALSLLVAFGRDPRSPVSLAKRHVLLERQLRMVLRTLSNLVNYLLKQAQVLPDLPEMVIAAAAEAEASEAGPSTPNLLNVLVEIGDRSSDSDDPEDSEVEEVDSFDEGDPERSMTHLVAVHLRLADIEFSDTQAALWRSKLQEALMKLKRLGHQYQKLQQEKARAEAEDAWRAIWFEE